MNRELRHKLENLAIARAQPNGYQSGMVRGSATSDCGEWRVDCVPDAWGALNYQYFRNGERVAIFERKGRK